MNSPSYTKEEPSPEVNEPEESTNSGMTTSELILNVFRTALDVVRKINKNRSRSTELPSRINGTEIQVSFTFVFRSKITIPIRCNFVIHVNTNCKITL